MKYFSYLILLFTFSSTAFSSLVHEDKIVILRIDEYAKDTWMAVDNFPKSGVSGDMSCRVHNVNGKSLYLMRIPDDDQGRQMYSMALAAQLSGRNIRVAMTDAHVDAGGFCSVEYLNLVL